MWKKLNQAVIIFVLTDYLFISFIALTIGPVSYDNIAVSEKVIRSWNTATSLKIGPTGHKTRSSQMIRQVVKVYSG